MNDNPLVTILIPSHNHEKLLELSVHSVLQQSIQSFEVIIIGDGLTPKTRQVAQGLCDSDSRISLEDFPKSTRTGEMYRHSIITERARGTYIAYVGDDDLLLPCHLERMLSELANYDFVHPLPVYINEKGILGVAQGDLAIDFVRKRIVEEDSYNFIGITGVMHSVEMYKKLPYGWRETPAGIPTDLYMWKQFLSMPECRARSSAYVTSLIFPSPGRKDWSMERRFEEIKEWSDCLAKPDGEHYLTTKAVEFIQWSLTWRVFEIEKLERQRLRKDF
jgi:glycosyltransferase involved in cell wall biosynthesis